MNHGHPKTRSDPNPQHSSGTNPMEHSTVEGHPEGSAAPRSEATGAPQGDGRRESGKGPSPTRDPVGRGSRQGIPGQRLIDPTETLHQAFLDGDPEAAYKAAQDLSEAYREVMSEASKLRFKVNFGSNVCENCDGLRAGPGVIATCFQVKRCDYANIKEGQESPTHQKLIRGLVRDP